MKKKVALFGTGWGAEILYKYVKGAFERLSTDGIDLYCYLCYALYGDPNDQKKGELNIYELAKTENFDGVLIFGNGLDFEGVFEDINSWAVSRQIPVISCGKKGDSSYFVGSDNYVGTKDMCNHLIEKHKARDILYLAGSRENADSNVRMRAISDSMKEHGLQLTEDRIFYSDWAPNKAGDYVAGLVESGAKLPDVICCANDNLAMIVCLTLARLGVDVPGQVIVTGFDYLAMSKVFTPSLSTVDQNFEGIGYLSADTIVRIMNGDRCEKEQYVPCRFIVSESCGCGCNDDSMKALRELGMTKYTKDLSESSFDRKIVLLERNIMNGKAFRDLPGCFEETYSVDHEYEGNTFFLFLEPSYKRTIAKNAVRFRKNGYSSKLELVYGMCNGIKVTPGTYDAADIIGMAEREQSRFFLYSPLHDRDNVYGYAVFCDDLKKILENTVFFRYIERLNMVFNKFHVSVSLAVVNRKLIELTETDVLTGVRNRTAYDSAEKQMDFRISSKSGTSFGVAVFDVNNLKKINDAMGHEAGDEYIINCCRLVCRNFKRSRVYRIGGDEFAVILENYDLINCETILENMRNEMKELQAEDTPDYEKVSIASGLSLYNPDTDECMGDVFNRADALMYANKAEMKMHKKDSIR